MQPMLKPDKIEIFLGTYFWPTNLIYARWKRERNMNKKDTRTMMSHLDDRLKQELAEARKKNPHSQRVTDLEGIRETIALAMREYKTLSPLNPDNEPTRIERKHRKHGRLIHGGKPKYDRFQGNWSQPSKVRGSGGLMQTGGVHGSSDTKPWSYGGYGGNSWKRERIQAEADDRPFTGTGNTRHNEDNDSGLKTELSASDTGSASTACDIETVATVVVADETTPVPEVQKNNHSFEN